MASTDTNVSTSSTTTKTSTTSDGIRVNLAVRELVESDTPVDTSIKDPIPPIISTETKVHSGFTHDEARNYDETDLIVGAMIHYDTKWLVVYIQGLPIKRKLIKTFRVTLVRPDGKEKVLIETPSDQVMVKVQTVRLHALLRLKSQRTGSLAMMQCRYLYNYWTRMIK